MKTRIIVGLTAGLLALLLAWCFIIGPALDALMDALARIFGR